MKIFIAGITIWLVGDYILTEVFNFHSWSVVAGYALGLSAAFVMLVVSKKG